MAFDSAPPAPAGAQPRRSRRWASPEQMAQIRVWSRVLAAALGVAAAAGAGQLGVAYGLGLVRLARNFPSDGLWSAQLTWIAWFAALAALAGAACGVHLAPRWELDLRVGGRVGVGVAAGLGAAIVVPLAAMPARAAVLLRPELAQPALDAALAAVLGVVVGILAAVLVLSVRLVAVSVTLLIGLVWLIALISAAPSLPAGAPLPEVRLAVLDLPVLAGAQPTIAVLSAPLLALLVCGAISAAARTRGLPPLQTAAATAAAPGLLALAYLIGSPGTGDREVQTTPYAGALIAVAVGLLVSLLVGIIRVPGTGEPTGDATASFPLPDRVPPGVATVPTLVQPLPGVTEPTTADDEDTPGSALPGSPPTEPPATSSPGSWPGTPAPPAAPTNPRLSPSIGSWPSPAGRERESSSESQAAHGTDPLAGWSPATGETSDQRRAPGFDPPPWTQPSRPTPAPAGPAESGPATVPPAADPGMTGQDAASGTAEYPVVSEAPAPAKRKRKWLSRRKDKQPPDPLPPVSPATVDEATAGATEQPTATGAVPTPASSDPVGTGSQSWRPDGARLALDELDSRLRAAGLEPLGRRMPTDLDPPTGRRTSADLDPPTGRSDDFSSYGGTERDAGSWRAIQWEPAATSAPATDPPSATSPPATDRPSGPIPAVPPIPDPATVARAPWTEPPPAFASGDSAFAGAEPGGAAFPDPDDGLETGAGAEPAPPKQSRRERRAERAAEKTERKQAEQAAKQAERDAKQAAKEAARAAKQAERAAPPPEPELAAAEPAPPALDQADVDAIAPPPPPPPPRPSPSPSRSEPTEAATGDPPGPPGSDPSQTDDPGEAPAAERRGRRRNDDEHIDWISSLASRDEEDRAGTSGRRRLRKDRDQLTPPDDPSF